jgi:phospholipase C
MGSSPGTVKSLFGTYSSAEGPDATQVPALKMRGGRKLPARSAPVNQGERTQKPIKFWKNVEAKRIPVTQNMQKATLLDENRIG